MRASQSLLTALGLILFSVNCVSSLDNDANLHPAALGLQQRNPQRQVQEIPDVSLSRNKVKADVGTKDAPIDGQDGKPHAGPFVDSQADKLAALTKPVRKEQAAAEDGVMNDPLRPAPQKGTTGTEGGVSEKQRQKDIDEVRSGRPAIKKPEAPKEPIAIKEKIKGELQESLDPLISTSKSKSSLKSTGDQTGHTDSQHGQSRSKEFSGKADDDSDESDGAHDLIPWDSLIGSFSSILATEIGDKTFIVAALMAMRHPRLQVFSAAASALFLMTVLSGLAGHAIGAIISKRWSAVLAAILFLVFGGKAIQEGLAMDANAGTSEEMREVQAELEEKEVDIARQEDSMHRRASSISPYALESGRMSGARASKRSPSSSPSGAPRRTSMTGTFAGIKNLLGLILSPAWVETFSMTFIGELGDRSQIATVAMAAGQEYFWIIVGATLGHICCTSIAVLGGSVLAGRVSMRKVTLAGGGIFVFFGILTFLEAIQYWV